MNKKKNKKKKRERKGFRVSLLLLASQDGRRENKKRFQIKRRGIGFILGRVERDPWNDNMYVVE